MILVVDDDRMLLASLRSLLARAGYEVCVAASPDEAMAAIRVEAPRLVLMDMNYTRGTSGSEGLTLLRQVKLFRPDTPVILMTAWGSIDLAVEGMRNGAFDFITKPWDNNRLLERIATALSLNDKSGSTPSDTPRPFERKKIIGDSNALREVLAIAARVAPTGAPVLITGESGTGKELLAETLHRNSPRASKPFIKVNLGGMPGSLFESEMFGHTRGAFTGAVAERIGRFEAADGGTIFLDEVGELPLSTQVRLLRVLQSGEFLRVGSARAQKTNVRVVAATNNDLLKSIETGRFREDLYYRLNTVPIAVPALRERPEDIPLLFRKFAADIAVQYHMPAVTLDEGARQLLQNYYWRGNIRQLKNVAEQISALERNRTVTADILAGYLSPNQSSAHTMTVSGAAAGGDFSTERELLYKILFDMRSDINDLKRMLGEMMHGTTHTPAQPTQHEVIGLLPSSVVARPAEEDYAESEEVVDEPRRELSKSDMQREQIVRALKNNNGRRRDAARELFMSERTLYRRIKELGITDENI